MNSTYRDKLETEARAKTFWGDSREDVLKNLVTNGIAEVEANTLVQEMFQERADTIRAIGRKKILVGLPLIAIPVAVWIVFVWVLHYLPVKLFMLPASIGVYGAYLALKGSIMCLSPNNETGDISET